MPQSSLDMPQDDAPQPRLRSPAPSSTSGRATPRATTTAASSLSARIHQLNNTSSPDSSASLTSASQQPHAHDLGRRQSLKKNNLSALRDQAGRGVVLADSPVFSSQHLLPYSRSPSSSTASFSHANLLETSSVASSTAVTDDDLQLSAATTSPPRAATSDPSASRRPSRTQKLFTSLTRVQSIRTTEAMSPTFPRSTANSSSHSSSSHHRYLSPSARGRMPFVDDMHTSASPPPREPLTLETSVPRAPGPMTAPLQVERGFRHAMAGPELRNRSADRRQHPDDAAHRPTKPSASREGLFNAMMEHGGKAAGGLGRLGKGFVGKFTRRASSVEKKPATVLEKHQLIVIRLPLSDQARITRLAKLYVDARDKTQYWLPALPYRCIDYLNLKGIDEVGIYRQSGSKTEIDRYLAKFDTGPKFDVNLLDEPNLNDVHIVSSVFKDWLRNLPDPLIPNDAQGRMVVAITDREHVPQTVKDELSGLAPHNYYLLFAITCHISLLHANAAKNFMTFENLCTCFMRSLKVDPPIFALLILKWRDCWQGCHTEADYLAEERNYDETHSFNPYHAHESAVDDDASDGSKPSPEEDRALSSSSSRGPAPSTPFPPSSSKSDRPSAKRDVASSSDKAARPHAAGESSTSLPYRPATAGAASQAPQLGAIAKMSPMQL